MGFTPSAADRCWREPVWDEADFDDFDGFARRDAGRDDGLRWEARGPSGDGPPVIAPSAPPDVARSSSSVQRTAPAARGGALDNHGTAR